MESSYDLKLCSILPRLHFLVLLNGGFIPEREALLLFALIDGITLHYLDDTAQYPIDDMQQLLINKYSNGHFLD